MTPVLRTDEGREIPLPDVSLQPDEARTLDLQEMVDSKQIRIPGNPFGSLSLRYTAMAMPNIYAATMVHMPGHLRRGRPVPKRNYARFRRTMVASDRGFDWIPLCHQ